MFAIHRGILSSRTKSIGQQWTPPIGNRNSRTSPTRLGLIFGPPIATILATTNAGIRHWDIFDDVKQLIAPLREERISYLSFEERGKLTPYYHRFTSILLKSLSVPFSMTISSIKQSQAKPEADARASAARRDV